MRWLARRKAEQNQAAIDPWTVVHFASGLAAGLVGMSLARSLGLAVAYEGVEQLLERSSAGQDLLETSGPETLPNLLVDLAIFTVGHQLGSRWNLSDDPASGFDAG